MEEVMAWEMSGEEKKNLEETVWAKFFIINYIYTQTKTLSPKAQCIATLLKCLPWPSQVPSPKDLVTTTEKLQPPAPSHYLK